MGILSHFDFPGRLSELPADQRELWSQRTVGPMVANFADQFPQFYDPTTGDTPDHVSPTHIVWGAFPARVAREEGFNDQARWERADSRRAEQDEYCEWSLERDENDTITRVTFTTEVPEYWEHLARDENHDKLLELYRQHVDSAVEMNELFDNDGKYNPANKWNNTTTGRLAHLAGSTEGSPNKLSAALQLAAEATILRKRQDGTPVTDRQELVVCGGLGDPFRSSDPQIAEVVNDAASLGAEVTLLDPFGVHLDGFQSAGIETPDGEDAATFWTIERGSDTHAVRASFAVPETHGYKVGDLKIHGQKIDWGAQVADKVRIRISALAKPAKHTPAPQLCKSG